MFKFITNRLLKAISKRTITEVIDYPDHGKRSESKEFRQSKEQLKDDGLYKCFICGALEDLQVHHFGCSWALENNIDFDKLKAFLEMCDIYGYSAKMKNIPITTVDDVRNMMVLCQNHHTGKSSGIHSTTFVAWIMQLLEKDGIDSVPQNE